MSERYTGEDGFPDEEIDLLDQVEEYRADWATGRGEPAPIAKAIRLKALMGEYTSEALQEDDPVSSLSKTIGILEDGARPPERQGGKRPPIAPDRHLETLSRIAAVDAQRDARVEGFRRVVLDGRLLKPDRVGPWITARAKREGPPTRFVELPISADRIPQSRREIKPGMRFSLRHLRYEVGTGDTHVVPIVDGGYLDGLRNLAEGPNGLAHRYGWHPARVPRFVLTDEPPPISRASTTVTEKRPFPAAAKIKLEISPRMTPDEVRALYVEARADLPDVPSRVRAMSDKHAELAVFAFEHREGRSWVDVMGLWNERFPEWRYDLMELFNRDAHKAYQRVTGERLEWIGKSA
jgi:hypothetical protein